MNWHILKKNGPKNKLIIFRIIKKIIYKSERTKMTMVDKSEILRQMRKHAKTFSSAIGRPKEVDQKSINHALALLDLFAKESNYGSLRKLSINIPYFLKVLRSDENFYFFRRNPHRKNASCFSGVTHLKNKEKKRRINSSKQKKDLSNCYQLKIVKLNNF